MRKTWAATGRGRPCYGLTASVSDVLGRGGGGGSAASFAGPLAQRRPARRCSAELGACCVLAAQAPARGSSSPFPWPTALTLRSRALETGSWHWWVRFYDRINGGY